MKNSKMKKLFQREDKPLMTSWFRYEYKGQFIDADRFNPTADILAYFKKHNIPESEYSKIRFVTQMVSGGIVK